MPVGGPLGYDSFMAYTFIGLVGYGQPYSGYLRTWLRANDAPDMLDIDLNEDLKVLGSRGDGLWSHCLHKLYLLFDCLYELCYLLLLVLTSCKILIHSMTKM